MYYFYYFPLGTEARLARKPAVTIVLTVVLVVVHYLLHFFKPTVHLFWEWVLPTGSPSLLQAFTACFVHADLFHLSGNILYLITFGPALEDRIGRWQTLGFYLLAGLASMLVQVEAYRMLYPDRPPIVVMGASGAISGLLGLFAMRAWFLRVRVAHATVAYLQAMAKAGITLLPAWVALAAWTLLQGIYTLVGMGGEGTGTAYWSHLSGLGLGLLVGAATGMIRRGRWERRLVAGNRFLERGEWYAALGEFQAYAEMAGRRAEGKMGEGRCHQILGRTGDAIAAYGDAFALLCRAERWKEAGGVAAEMRRVSPTTICHPESMLLLASYLEDNDEVIRALELYERLGRFDPRPHQGVAAWKRAALLARDQLGDLRRAAAAYESAAERLIADAGAAEDTAEVSRLRGRSRDCRRVFIKRLRFASPGA